MVCPHAIILLLSWPTRLGWRLGNWVGLHPCCATLPEALRGITHISSHMSPSLLPWPIGSAQHTLPEKESVHFPMTQRAMPHQLPRRPSLLMWHRLCKPATCRSVIEIYSRRPLKGDRRTERRMVCCASGGCPSMRCSEHTESNSNSRLIPAPLHFPWGQPCAAGTFRPLASRRACGAEITCRPSAAAAQWTGATDLAGRFRRKSNSTASRAGDALCSPPGLAGTAALASAQWCVVCQAAKLVFWRPSRIKEKQILLQWLVWEVLCSMLTVPSFAKPPQKSREAS